ncbi:hypothetical protein AXK60_12225 [Tsukamurella pseudospumae]|uniref:Uncharacterized protein n=1 Tax=Tsukamurella pseudospumae TaxID=239498 RepID=A0A138A8Q2_9ACTN|nr:hypothetical protein AXK60_12225 [Tsukamurella pseudospumae]
MVATGSFAGSDTQGATITATTAACRGITATVLGQVGRDMLSPCVPRGDHDQHAGIPVPGDAGVTVERRTGTGEIRRSHEEAGETVVSVEGATS